MHLPYPSWDEHLYALIDRFSAEYDDPMAELKLLFLTGAVKDYQDQFDRSMNRLALPMEYAINCFIAGLRPEYKDNVKAHKPNSLPQLTTYPCSNAPYKPPESISQWNKGHKCKTKKQLLLLELEEGMELESENQRLYVMKVEEVQEEEVCETSKEAEVRGEVDPVTISLNALNRVTDFHTLRVTGYTEKGPVSVLIDTGSTHNFLDSEVTKLFGCQVQRVNPKLVSVADGGTLYAAELCKGLIWMLQGTTFQTDLLWMTLGTCDMVLGVQWLQTLGDIRMDFTQLTMEFQLYGKKYLLQCDDARLKTVDAIALGKMAEGKAQLFMVRVLPTEDSKEAKISQSTGIEPGIRNLIEEYQVLFSEPSGLPPSRVLFDHKIPLEAGSNPINIRPYRKKDVSWRLCVDYRALNKSTTKDKFPIQIIEELLDELGGSKVYTKIDLRSGYHQTRMDPADVAKTVFRTHSGHYEYLVMPFGLTSAPSYFQGLMNHIFKEYLRKFILIFFDDILVFSKSMEEHLLRGFLRLARYYRRFIQRYRVISKPLTDLLNKDSFHWSDKATPAFEALKTALVTAPKLALADSSQQFIVETDACDIGIE
ncbi:PREDICTED: uncharacterized protein LOC109235975 [Nicotiana attenuata]|uniref:uncharacterized protein LOC109235975 n=1 Tax=Nicotiana attenuata TaxID=49451 RepID=UPI000905AF0E|nr:PREDICTED: uncharacterized protein LOC109235975 [Nicotiana attenuata]